METLAPLLYAPWVVRYMYAPCVYWEKGCVSECYTGSIGMLLAPANEDRESNVFTGMCPSTGGG